MPAEDIQDGLFRIHLKTSGTDARAVATVLGVVSQSLAAQNGVAPALDLSEIEIDAQSQDKYWQPSALFPTLDSYKSAVVDSLAGVLRFNATVECAKVNHHGH